MLSPEGSKMRSFALAIEKNQLLEAIKDKKENIKNILSNSPMILFLKHKKNDDIFGGDENARIVFSRLLNPEKGETPDENTSFNAVNMCKMMNGQEHKTLLGKKDLENLDVVSDTEELINMLMKVMGK